MPDVIITPSSGIIDFFPASTRVGRIDGSGNIINILNPSGYVALSSSGLSINTSAPNATLHAYSATSGATLLNLEGTNGSLFSVIDSLSGSLMSVNNNAGLPVFEVFSDDRVVAGRFGQNDFIMTSGGNVGIGTGVPSTKFHVVGNSTFGGDVTTTGSFIAPSGSAALPSYEFIGDPDTGLFSPSANTFSISTSGVERLRVNNVGGVAIGTTNYTFNNLTAGGNANLSINSTAWIHNALQIGPEDNGYDYSWITNGAAIFNTVGVGEKGDFAGNAVIINTNGLVVNNAGGTGGTACELLSDYGATIKPNLIVNSNGNGPARLGVGTGTPSVELHVNGNSLINSGNFTTALTIGNSGVATWDVPILSLGTISGTNSINWGTDRTMQNCTLNGTATTLNKGTGWPSTNGVSREVTLNIYASGNTSVTWNIVNDWYRQPDSPLPSGNHIVLFRAISSGVIQGHYIGNKTN